MRDRILRRDLRDEAIEANSSGCEVLSGRLVDPYTAGSIRFVRGGRADVDIDHVVALGDAWQKGAQRWPYARRVAFANDPLNLLAVTARANRQKGDGDAATWLPANKSFRCRYVARRIAAKRRYHAWVTRPEHDAMQRVLAGCRATALPTIAGVRVPIAHRSGAGDSSGPSSPRATAPTDPPATSPNSGQSFANCDAVRAAEVAPLRRGTRAYAANPQLDRDHDGLACE